MAIPAVMGRDGYPILGSCTYLNSAVKGALHNDVRAAALDYLDDWDRWGAPWDLWLAALDDCRSHFARLVGASSTDVFVSGSVSVALASVITSQELRDRPELLVFYDGFPTVTDVALAARRLGAEVRVLPAPANGAELIAAVQREASERTAAVLVEWIHHAARYEVDLAGFSKACHAVGAYAIVDGYHGVGALDVRVAACGVDVLASGAMKYLLGSAGGLALAYCDPGLTAKAQPILGGWLGSDDPFAPDRDHLKTLRSARRFETGLNGIGDAVMLRAALIEITRWRMTEIDSHVRQLARDLESRLSQIVDTPSRIRTCGPLLTLRARDAARLATQLASHDVIVGSWREWVRFSFHGYNNGDDVERAAKALTALSGSTAL